MDARPDDKVVLITTTPAIAVGRGATLRDAAHTLARANVGALVVVGDDTPAGLLSEKDIVRALADGADPDDVQVSEVMSEDPRYVTAVDAISHVAKRMLEVGVRHMPVYAKGDVVGMVSARDALQVFSDTFEQGEATLAMPAR